jgi:hypothetical protein
MDPASNIEWSNDFWSVGWCLQLRSFFILCCVWCLPDDGCITETYCGIDYIMKWSACDDVYCSYINFNEQDAVL